MRKKETTYSYDVYVLEWNGRDTSYFHTINTMPVTSGFITTSEPISVECILKYLSKTMFSDFKSSIVPHQYFKNAYIPVLKITEYDFIVVNNIHKID